MADELVCVVCLKPLTPDGEVQFLSSDSAMPAHLLCARGLAADKGLDAPELTQRSQSVLSRPSTLNLIFLASVVGWVLMMVVIFSTTIEEAFRWRQYLVVAGLIFVVSLLVLVVWFKRQGRTASGVGRLGLVSFIVLLSAFVSLMLGYGIAVFLNGALDKSEPTTHVVVVTGKHEEYSDRQRTTWLYLHFRSWTTPGKNDTVSVSSSLYTKAVPGRTKIAITTKPGWLGREWQVTYRPIEE